MTPQKGKWSRASPFFLVKVDQSNGMGGWIHVVERESGRGQCENSMNNSVNGAIYCFHLLNQTNFGGSEIVNEAKV